MIISSRIGSRGSAACVLLLVAHWRTALQSLQNRGYSECNQRRVHITIKVRVLQRSAHFKHCSWFIVEKMKPVTCYSVWEQCSAEATLLLRDSARLWYSVQASRMVQFEVYFYFSWVCPCSSTKLHFGGKYCTSYSITCILKTLHIACCIRGDLTYSIDNQIKNNQFQLIRISLMVKL